MSIYSDGRFALLSGYAVVVAWVLWVALVAGIVLGNLFYEQLSFVELYAREVAILVAAFSLFAFLMLVLPVCPNCGGRVFSGPKSDLGAGRSKRQWYNVVIEVVSKHKFKCLHCGEICGPGEH